MARGVRAGRAYVEIGTEQGALEEGLKLAQSKLSAFGSAVQDLGAKMMALSGAILAPLGAGTKAFADFEQQMANVATVLERPKEHMESFNKGIQKMSVEFGESTETLSKGLYDILSASIAPSKAMDILGVSSKAAKAGLTTTAIAADAITTILNSYGMSAEKAADVSDWLFKVVLRGKITFEELASQIGNTASLSHTAGLSLDEVGGFISTLTKNGVKGSVAMTGLNAVIKSFLKPSEEAAKTAAEVGFKLDGTTLKTKGLVGVFNQLAGLPPDVIAKLFPDIDALKGVLPAMNNLKAFGEDVAAMAGRAGSTETAYQQMSGTIVATMARVRESVVSVFTAIGEAMSESTKEFLKATLEILERAREWIATNKELIPVIAQFALGIGAAGAALVLVGMIIGAISAPFGALASVIGIVGSAIGAVVSAVGMLFGPLGLVVVALIASGRAFLNFMPIVNETMRSLVASVGVGWMQLKAIFKAGMEFITALWQGKTVSLNAAWRDFTVNVGQAWSGLQIAMRLSWFNLSTGLMEGWSVLQGWLLSTWAQLKDAWAWVSGFVSAAWQGDTNLMFTYWSSFIKKTTKLWESVKELLFGEWGLVRKMWKTTTEFLFQELDKSLAKMGTSWKELTKTAENYWKRVKDFWREHGGVITAFASSLLVVVGYLRLFGAASVLLGTIWAGVVATISAGLLWVTTLFSPWALVLGVIIALVVEIAKKFYELIPAVRKTVDKISGHWRKTWGAVWEALKAGFEFVQSAFSGDAEKMNEAWASFTEKVDVAWREVKDALAESWKDMERLWNRKDEVLERGWLAFTEGAQSAWDKAWAHIQAKWKEIEPTFNRVVAQALNAVWDRMLGAMKDKFLSVYADIINEVRNFWAWLWRDADSQLFERRRRHPVPMVDPRLSSTLAQVSRQVGGIPRNLTVTSSLAGTSPAAAPQDFSKLLASSERTNRNLETVIRRIDALQIRFS